MSLKALPQENNKNQGVIRGYVKHVGEPSFKKAASTLIGETCILSFNHTSIAWGQHVNQSEEKASMLSDAKSLPGVCPLSRYDW